MSDADMAALREALERIRDSGPPPGSWDGWREVGRLRDIAEAALAVTEAQPHQYLSSAGTVTGAALTATETPQVVAQKVAQEGEPE